MTNALKAVILLAFIQYNLPPVQAHGGGSVGSENSCNIYFEKFKLMVTGYQPYFSEQKEYCSALPSLTESIIVFDIVDSPLREVPLSVQIVELSNESEKEGEEHQHHHGKTVTAIPFEQQRSGTVHLTFTPEEGIQYAAVLTTLDEAGHPSSIDFPFTVGEISEPLSAVEKILITFLITVLIVCGYFAYKPKKSPKQKKAKHKLTV